MLTHQIAISSLRGLTPALVDEIVHRLGSVEAFFALPERELQLSMGFGNKLFDSALRARTLDAAYREEEFVNSSGVTPIYYTDPRYPQRLLGCDDAPLMLYAYGSTDLNHSRFISIVGTRHATPYGIDFVERFCREMAECLPEPPVIVSGLAYGIDVAAHRSALKHGLPTIGVLAHGLNTIYPANHRQVAVEMIHSGGMLLTEYRSTDAIHKGNFLARNRIVAGLCDALLVVESAAKGGALVTARIASAYSRDVFALPGRISDPYSAGCNQLIARSVAQLINSPADLPAALNWPVREPEGTQRELFAELPPEQQQIIDILTNLGDASLTDISSRIHIPTPRLMGLLVDMEFAGLITNLPGAIYRRR